MAKKLNIGLFGFGCVGQGLGGMLLRVSYGLLSMAALISVSVGFMNLLPIPILDGGQILIMLAESIKGGSLATRTRVWLFYSGLAAILLLFSIVTFNDLTSLVKRIFHL